MSFASLLFLSLSANTASAGGFPFFSSIPVEYTNPREHPHPDCPEESHILGHGQGETILAARKASRADILRQIRSSIDAELERVSTVFQNGRNETSSTSLKSTIVEHSSFDYGEMILDIGKTYKRKKQHFALSCLHRKETAEHIYNDIEIEKTRLLALSNQLHSFYQKSDRVGFSTHYPQTQTLFESLLPKLLQIRSLASIQQIEDAIQELSQIEREADTLVSSMRIGITPIQSIVPIENNTQLISDLSQILQEHQLITIPSTTECSADLTHNMYLTINPDCNVIMGNHICTLEASLSLIDCTRHTPQTIPIIGTLKGAHSRKKQKAIGAAAQKISLEENRKGIEQLLRKNAPIQ
jgi:hypothetical protein